MEPPQGTACAAIMTPPAKLLQTSESSSTQTLRKPSNEIIMTEQILPMESPDLFISLNSSPMKELYSRKSRSKSRSKRKKRKRGSSSDREKREGNENQEKSKRLQVNENESRDQSKVKPLFVFSMS